MSIRQWDTDWFDQFKTFLATDLTTLIVDAGKPLWWCPIQDVAFGNKQVQPGIRKPDQQVRVSKNTEYDDKYAERLVQTADLPSITDSIRIEEEYAAGDPQNASGHVGDLAISFMDGLANYYVVGTSVDPLTYGLIDAGAGTGVTTITRPDIVDAITTTGDWETAANVNVDLAAMEAALNKQGFRGTKVICANPILKPFLKNMTITNTAQPIQPYVLDSGYAMDYSTYYDIDATTDACDVYMVDAGSFRIHQWPVIAKAFYEDKTEYYYYRWKTRGILLAKPKHNDTDWKKGIVKCTIDIYD